MTLGFDSVPDFFNLPVRANQERTSYDTHVGSAHEFLLLPGTESFDYFVIGIAEQGKIEFVFFFERSEGFYGIGAHAQDGHAKFVELFLCVAKLGRFYRSARGVSLGKEKEQNTFTLKFLRGKCFAIFGFQLKAWSLIACLEHCFCHGNLSGRAQLG
jgi:hypothetical protein